MEKRNSQLERGQPEASSKIGALASARCTDVRLYT